MRFAAFAAVAALLPAVLAAPQAIASTSVSTIGSVSASVATSGSVVVSMATSGLVPASTATSGPVSSTVTASTRPVSTIASGTTIVSTIIPSGTTTGPGAGATPFPPNSFQDKLYEACFAADKSAGFKTTFNKSTCVALLLGPQSYSVDQVISDLWFKLIIDISSDPIPTSKSQSAFSVNIFNQNSSDKKVWTQQNFIDFYYSTLSSVGGPFPNSVDEVIAAWNKVAAWTGFCQTKAVPYANLADYLKFSSDVNGAVAKC